MELLDVTATPVTAEQVGIVQFWMDVDAADGAGA